METNLVVNKGAVKVYCKLKILNYRFFFSAKNRKNKNLVCLLVYSPETTIYGQKDGFTFDPRNVQSTQLISSDL